MTFTQPRAATTPPVQVRGEDDPITNRLFRHYPPSLQAVNVYILTDGTVTEEFPASTYNADGSLALKGEERIARAFTGTGPHTITDAEAAILTGAGYEVD